MCASNRLGMAEADRVKACVGGDIFYQRCYQLYRRNRYYFKKAAQWTYSAKDAGKTSKITEHEALLRALFRNTST